MSTASDWSQGYVTDILYTDHTYREMSPAWLNYVAALKGCHPRPLDKPFVYVELGCGLGRTIAHLAAAFPLGQFIGVDFNPAHIDAAQRYAADLGLGNVRFLERGFQDLVGEAAARSLDLPEVDFVALHGVYSWISPAARKAVQQFIHDRLKPGGFVYNSYNCLPGWTPEEPSRRLLMELAQGHDGSTDARLVKALDQLDEFSKIDSGYFKLQPGAKAAVQQYRTRPANYLAHEMMNADWALFYSADVADEMAVAKLDFLGSASLVENQAELLFADAAAAIVAKQPDMRRKQLMQDFLLNTRFRRDIFVRGHARLPLAQLNRNRGDQVVLALKRLGKMEPKLKIPRGVANIDARVLTEFDAVLAKGSVTLRELAQAVGKGGNMPDFFHISTLLAATNALMPAVGVHRVTKGFDGSGQLRVTGAVNQRLLTLARASSDAKARYLTSPVAGGVLPISLIGATLLGAFTEAGGIDRAITASLEVLAQQGVHLRKEDKPVTDPVAKRAYLAEICQNFIGDEAPVLMAAGIVEAV
jgi:SAM-dependent methyltransferase